MNPAIERLQSQLDACGYVTDPALATTLYLALELPKPLLIEGHAGVGKTEVAKVLAQVLETELIRLQCYEGLDAATALYEWNYSRQMLRIRLMEGSSLSAAEKEESIFSEPFLLKRPLLSAITHPERAPVLLIDEVDRSDEEFEAFLLEVLSDFQVSIPEVGTVRATHPPVVVLTSNRTRDLSDALRRRCLYLWMDYPSFDKELRIVQRKVPGVGARLAEQVTTCIQRLRGKALEKVPGVAETLDWARALAALNATELEVTLVRDTMGCFVKDEPDLRRMADELDESLWLR